MKLLRVCLLTLLAVLLPIRGAMAASMLCPAAGSVGHTEAVFMPHAGEAHEHRGHAGHDSHDSHGDHHEHAAGMHGHSSDDKCNLCSSLCASPSLPSASPGIEEPQFQTSLQFPQLCAPAPTFLSDGQERPPRTI